MLERELTGRNQFFGDESFLKFGKELHKRFLEPKRKREKFSKEDEEKLAGMLKSLRSNKTVMAIMKGATKEQRTRALIHGQMFKVILDIDKRALGADIKTTSCETYTAFVKSMEKYDYGRQGKLYSVATLKEEFIFIGIGKKKPHPVFIVDLAAYQYLVRKGWKKAKLLINVHKALKKYYEYIN